MLELTLVKESKNLIQPYIFQTPLDQSIYLSDENKKIYFKNEGLQHTKSFKLRGAFSKLLRLSEEEKSKGVIAVSSGNHGIAVSYACQVLGIDKVLIFVPENTPESKTSKIKLYGGEIIIEGKTYDDAHKIGMAYVQNHNMTYIDGYDKDPLIYAGQGTAGLEILEKKPSISSILVPIGGGGLITGIAVAAKAIKPNIKIIGVQTEACPAMKASIEDQKLYSEYPSDPSVCEALIGGIGQLAYQHKSLIDDILIVKETTIKKAIGHMIKKEKLIVEPSSCTVVAALMDYPDYDFGKNVALLLSGSNIDTDLMMQVL